MRPPVRAPPPLAALLDALRDRAEGTHAQECADAALNFPAHLDISDCSFADDDFVTHRVEPQVRAGPDLAGPDASRLRGATRIHQTVRPILSDEEIGALRAEASAAISSGLQSNFTYTQENKLGEVHTADLPVAREWLTRRLHDTLYPMLSERYDLDPTKLRVFDSLIINYDASRGAVRQPVHRDASLLSINVALSSCSDYDGGGTYFEGLRRRAPHTRDPPPPHEAQKHTDRRDSR